MTDVRVSDQEVDVSEQLFEGAQRAREYDEAPEERLVENGAEVVGAEDFELHVESEVITDDSDFVDQQVVVDPNEYQYPVYQEPEPQVQPSVPRAELRAPEKTVGVRATWGKRGVLNRFGFRFRPGQIETAHLDEVRVIRQATWTRPVRILVGNTKSSAKTPATVILGGIFASIRGGMVAAWESAESAGTLTRRAEGFPERGVYELLRDADSVTNAGILGGYTQPQTSHLDVIGSVSEHPLLEADDIFRVAQILDRDYRICVMDTGNVLRSSAFGASLALADVLVIPVVWSGVDTAFAALDLIEKLESSGNAHWQALAQNAIIVTSHDGRPESKETMERISSALRACTHRAIFDVPFDPHIALGEQITLSALSRESMWTWTTCSAEVIRTLQDMVQ